MQSILYTNTYVTFDSAVLSEATSVKINKNPSLNSVATLAKGFSGINLGAAMCEITVETAIPSADFEFNPDAFMTIGKQVTVGVVMANRQMAAKMFISEADYNAGVNQAASLSIKLIGPLAQWE
jgi:hypothetical protein